MTGPAPLPVYWRDAARWLRQWLIVLAVGLSFGLGGAARFLSVAAPAEAASEEGERKAGHQEERLETASALEVVRCADRKRQALALIDQRRLALHSIEPTLPELDVLTPSLSRRLALLRHRLN